MNQLKLKSLLVVKVCNLLLAEEMDVLKGTTVYKQDIKNLVNTLSTKLDKEYNETYNLYDNDEDAEMGLNYALDIVDKFVKTVSSMKKSEEFIELGEKLNNLKLELA